MRLSKSWIIASKDFKTFRKKRNIIYSILPAPLIVSFLLPIVIECAGHRSGGSGLGASELAVLLPAFTFFYLIIAAYIPIPICLLHSGRRESREGPRAAPSYSHDGR